MFVIPVLTGAPDERYDPLDETLNQELNVP